MKNPTCYSCIWSFGTFDNRKENSTLICWPSGNRDREQIAHKICDEYFRESGADERENVNHAQPK